MEEEEDNTKEQIDQVNKQLDFFLKEMARMNQVNPERQIVQEVLDEMQDELCV